jgi:tetratricopeptide (TPR) repeat protein
MPDHRALAAVLVALAVGLYANTLGHGYALDDRLVITHNEFVRAGWSGLPEILSEDYLRGYLAEKANPMTGGRYRPLSLVTFAIEAAVFGPDHPFVGHLVNVLLYALCCVLVYRVAVDLLAERAPERGWLSLPFLAALLFTVHPLHTEVVANIKSRDEILALSFALASVLLALRAVDRRAAGPAIGAAVCFFLALFSKESAITFLAVVPLSLWFFRADPREALARVMPGIGASAAAYLVLRAIFVAGPSAPGGELLNDPFLGASRADTWATIFSVLGRYAQLVVWPHPLTHDYAPYHIAISTWREAGPWLGLVLHLGLAALALSGLRTRGLPAYAAAFYLSTLSIGSNVVVPTGTFLAERFLFAPTVGAALGFAWLLRAGIPRREVAAALAIAASAALGALTVLRNPAWKDSYTLFTTDVAISRDSALANANAADVQLIRASATADREERARLEAQAVAHLETALRVHPRYVRALEMLSVAQGRRGDGDASLAAVERLFALDPRRGKVAFNAGTLILKHQPGRSADAVRYLERAVEFDPGDGDAHANLGVAYYQTGDLARAIASFERAVALAPDRADHRKNLAELRAEVGR